MEIVKRFPKKNTYNLTMYSERRRDSSLSLALFLSIIMQTWKFPSPAWATIGHGIQVFSNSTLLFSIKVAKLEIGTATSVIHGTKSGYFRGGLKINSQFHSSDFKRELPLPVRTTVLLFATSKGCYIQWGHLVYPL